MEIKAISDKCVFSSLREAWNALVERTNSEALFMRHEWLLNWWDAFVPSGEPSLITAERGGELVGAIALKRTVEKVRGISAKRLSFLGDSSWTTGEVLVLDDDEAVVRAIADHILGLEWDVVDLRNAPDTPSMLALVGMLGEASADSAREDGAAFPYLRSTTAWEDFFRSRSTRFRKASRNKLNKIARKGEVSLRRYRRPEEMEEALGIIFDIGLKGWKHTIGNSVASTEANRAFYSGVARALSPGSGVDIWVLGLGGVDIAFEYHIRNRNYIIGLVGDFDEAYKDISPGSVLDLQIMRHLFEEESGCIYNMGSGSSFYKDNWTTESLRYKRHFFYRGNACGKIIGFTEKKLIAGLRGLRERFRTGEPGPRSGSARKKGY